MRSILEQRWIVAGLDALHRLQAETAADPPSSDFGGTGLDALIASIKGEL